MSNFSCTCNTCIQACAYGHPGWFKPGEAQKAAEFLKMEYCEFEQKYLFIDSWFSVDGDIPVLTPKKIFYNNEDDPDDSTMDQHWTKGRCIFLTNENRCQIHEVKPFECAKMNCKKGVWNGIRKHIADCWKRYWEKMNDFN